MVTKSKSGRQTVKHTQDPMRKIIESAKHGKLVVIVGAGMSVGLTNGLAPSWTGLIKNGFDYGVKKGRITTTQLTAWSSQLASSDMDDLLSAAEFMGRKLGGPTDQVYGRWLQEAFGSLQPTNESLASAIKALISRVYRVLCKRGWDQSLGILPSN